ncbi:MAG: TonB-dependent receptor, partial [Flavobacteriaceae bacterium]
QWLDENETVIVKRVKNISLKESNIDLNQQLTIKGAVRGEDGNFLVGASIVEKGTTNGTQSDFDGNFSLTVTDKNTILSVSYIGYETKEVQVANQTNLVITLLESTASLEEVVVIGYGAVKKSDLTGSIASIKSKDLNSFPTSDAVQALQGRAAGVVVQSVNGGEPGAEYTVRIRGNTSINSSNDPLFVVDGFPQGFLPSSEDIASIEILKDASATAIYGSRGANGVVLITTKKGRAGVMKINFNTSYSTQKQIKKYDLLNAWQYAEYVNELDALGNSSATFLDPASLGIGTDWQNEIEQQGEIKNYNLSVSGGNDNINYYVSGTLFDQKGIIRKSNFKRYSLLSNVNAKVSQRLNVGVNLSVRRIDSDRTSSKEGTTGGRGGGVLSSALIFTPTEGIFEVDGITYTSDQFQPLIDNPISLINEMTDDNINDYFQGLVFAEIKLLNNLKFKTVIGATVSNNFKGKYQSSRLNFGGGVGGIAEVENSKQTSVLLQNYLTYSLDFGEHSLIALGGYDYEKKKVMNNSSGASGFITDSFLYNNLNAGAVREILESFNSTTTLAAFYGRITYNFKDRYLLTATGRYDGSSVLAEGNEWDFFPSGALAWNVHNEDFLNKSNMVSQLKLRASYGVTGSQAVSPFSSLAILSTGVIFVFDGDVQNAVIPQTLANQNLMWERTAQTNLGVDLGFLKDKLFLTADYYDIKTTKLLFQAPIPAYLGLRGTFLKNIGETGNKGFELSLGVRDIGGTLRWNTAFNIAANKSTIVKLPDDGSDIFYASGAPGQLGLNNTQVLREGEPIGLFYGFVYEGVQQSGDVILTGSEGLGGEKFKDVNGDGILDIDGDRDIIGDPNPDFTWGWNNSFTYKDFDLNFFFQGSQGNEILNYTKFVLDDGIGVNNPTTDFLNRWTPTNIDTNVPKASITRSRRLSSRWVEDGSYIRLKNISLGYALPSKVIDKFNINSLRIYVSGQNLWTSTDYSGFDPEVGRNGAIQGIGIDFGSFPNTMSFTLGLSFSF